MLLLELIEKNKRLIIYIPPMGLFVLGLLMLIVNILN